jgi:hypothetical protein
MNNKDANLLISSEFVYLFNNMYFVHLIVQGITKNI